MGGDAVIKIPCQIVVKLALSTDTNQAGFSPQTTGQPVTTGHKTRTENRCESSAPGFAEIGAPKIMCHGPLAEIDEDVNIKI